MPRGASKCCSGRMSSRTNRSDSNLLSMKLRGRYRPSVQDCGAGRAADVRRRRAELAAKRMVEGGEIAETCCVSQRADRLARFVAVREHSVNAIEALAEHVFRQR